MKEFIRPALILAAVTLCAGILLGGVNVLTHERIEMLQKKTERQALEKVLPGYTITGKKFLRGDEEKPYWIGTKSDNGTTVRGYAFITEGPGYSGRIRIMVGVNEDETIAGISILSQTETPGLGARCTEIASKNTFRDFITGNTRDDDNALPWFQQQFRALDASKRIFIVHKGDWNKAMADKLRRNNEISAITGATITTKAVRDSVLRGIDEYRSIIK